MNQARKNDLKVESGLVAAAGLVAGMLRKNRYKVECIRDGQVIWTEEIDNLVVNVGLDDSLDKHLKGSAYTAAWYVGLTGADPTFAAGDTMASHAGWTEITAYTAANRLGWVGGTVSGQSVSNSANKAEFTINGTVTVGGAFMVSENTKGGTSGVLYGGGAFSQNRNLIADDILRVTVTATAAAA
jgi:hypothetical protein